EPGKVSARPCPAVRRTDDPLFAHQRAESQADPAIDLCLAKDDDLPAWARDLERELERRLGACRFEARVCAPAPAERANGLDGVVVCRDEVGGAEACCQLESVRV